jgi:hypothetical protein
LTAGSDAKLLLLVLLLVLLLLLLLLLLCEGAVQLQEQWA